MGLGRRYQIFEHWLNHRLLKTAHKKQLTELKEEILLEKGVEAFYELFLYSIIIGLPMYELYKSAESTEKKEKKLKEKIDSMERKLDTANDSLATLLAFLAKSSEQSQRLKEERQKGMQEYEARRIQQSIAQQEAIPTAQ